MEYIGVSILYDCWLDLKELKREFFFFIYSMIWNKKLLLLWFLFFDFWICLTKCKIYSFGFYCMHDSRCWWKTIYWWMFKLIAKTGIKLFVNLQNSCEIINFFLPLLYIFFFRFFTGHVCGVFCTFCIIKNTFSLVKK